MVGRQIDRIYLFGDCRVYHRQAIAIARRLKIEVYVFERGLCPAQLHYSGARWR